MFDCNAHCPFSYGILLYTTTDLPFQRVSYLYPLPRLLTAFPSLSPKDIAPPNMFLLL